MAGMGVIFKYPLGSAQISHLTDVTDVLEMGPDDVLGSFIRPLQSLLSIAPL